MNKPLPIYRTYYYIKYILAERKYLLNNNAVF